MDGEKIRRQRRGAGTTAASDLTTAVSSLSYKDFVDYKGDDLAQYGLDKPAETVTIVTEETEAETEEETTTEAVSETATEAVSEEEMTEAATETETATEAVTEQKRNRNPKPRPRSQKPSK